MKVLVTGVTGMVGEGVVLECLGDPGVERVLVVGRKPCGIEHAKLTEIVHADFFDLSPIAERLVDFDACFFCLGVSSVGMSEDDYRRKTYDLTLTMAKLLAENNPGMTFCYVSGSGTDSTEKGRSMWARVKGKTENDLLKLPFKAAYMFRAGYLHPTPGAANTHRYYRVLSWIYPIFRRLLPNHVSTLRELGAAMIRVSRSGYGKPIIEVKDIVRLARS